MANDAEGLCYDVPNNRLLLAYKDSAGKERELKDEKAIYAFDLNTKTIVPTPLAIITMNILQKKQYVL